MDTRMKEIGVDANPSTPGAYDVTIEGIRSMFPITLDFDGQLWNIDEEFWNRRIWWIDTNKNETSEPKSTINMTDYERAEFRFSLDCNYAFYGVKK